MRFVTLLFLAFILVDYATTIIGIRLGMQEINPIMNKWGWMPIIIINILGVIIITTILQIKKPNKMDILVPASVALFEIFNIVQIILTL